MKNRKFLQERFYENLLCGEKEAMNIKSFIVMFILIFPWSIAFGSEGNFQWAISDHTRSIDLEPNYSTIVALLMEAKVTTNLPSLTLPGPSNLTRRMLLLTTTAA